MTNEEPARTDDQIDDAIDAWHDGDGKVPLHEHLGWTRERFRAWVEGPAVVTASLTDRLATCAAELLAHDPDDHAQEVDGPRVAALLLEARTAILAARPTLELDAIRHGPAGPSTCARCHEPRTAWCVGCGYCETTCCACVAPFAAEAPHG